MIFLLKPYLKMVVFSVNSPSYVSTTNSTFISSTSGGGGNSYKSSTEANFVSINQTYVTGASFQDFKKRDGRINGKISAEIDSNANTVFKAIGQGVSQSTQTTVSFSSVTTNAPGGLFVPKVLSHFFVISLK